MDEANLTKLNLLRKKLEVEMSDLRFPYGCCSDAADEVERLFNWKRIPGSVRDPNGRYIGEHWWNFNPETKEYIDLTLDQFSSLSSLGIGPVTVVHIDSELAQTVYKLRYASAIFVEAMPCYI